MFRAQGAILVALPEVRVEESSTQRQRALHRWIRQHGDEAELIEDNGAKILLRPTSGHGADAIALANHLTEQVGPEMAQARFLRVVDASAARCDRVGDLRVLYNVQKDEVILLIVGRKVGNTLVVENEEFHGHQADPPESAGS